ncbi:MAG: AbrB/MazE/SpoVT family DNA-binding domain-containing protein [Desulfurococcales archaeon]|nr:AbrB/MazE/SpoVT family DNA-binding domain-containing protein [Desulfurococcales archaeon]
MRAEIRKLQRLGSGSIVVTIPKSWASRLGLEPGVSVMLIDEDDSIRILPLKGTQAGESYLDLSKVTPRLVEGLPICTYLTGLKKVRVRLPQEDGELLLKLISRAMNFVGLQVFSAGPSEARVEVLLDHDKIDHVKLIRNMGTVLEDLTRLLEDAIKKGQADMVKADLLRRELLRELYMAIRYLLSTHITTESIVSKELSALVASYLGLVIDLLYESLVLINTSDPSSLGEGDRRILGDLYGSLAGTSVMFVKAIASPSTSRVEALYGMVAQIKARAEDSLSSLETPFAGVLLGRIMDVVRVLTLASHILTCLTILERAKTV